MDSTLARAEVGGGGRRGGGAEEGGGRRRIFHILLQLSQRRSYRVRTSCMIGSARRKEGQRMKERKEGDVAVAKGPGGGGEEEEVVVVEVVVGVCVSEEREGEEEDASGACVSAAFDSAVMGE